MNSYHIFIVEDDAWYGEILQYHISLNPDIVVTRFETAAKCLEKLYLNPDLITLDFSLPDMPGDQLYKKIREVNASVPVIVISSQNDVGVAVNLLKAGVNDYLVKDESTREVLWKSIIRIRETQNLKQEVANLKHELGQKYAFQRGLLGQSDSLMQTFKLMEKACKTNINVSITGETGTGKELVAKSIHYNSDRARKPFIAVNVAAIPPTLIESELFGYEKGAFTGAVSSRPGRFEEATGGTLFLDEIAELDMALQSKLLRVLQEREVTRIGSSTPKKIDIRLITATHKNLTEEVKNGNFREDIYYRILGLPIELPPLRERGNDVLLLAKHFADAFVAQNNLGKLTISASAKKKLLKYHFPGNVRELKAVMDLAAVMCNGIEIDADDITFNNIKKNDTFFAEARTLRQYTCDIISHYLKKNDNDVLATARDLDIGKSTIYKMLQAGEIA